jgi:hypothetical protein
MIVTNVGRDAVDATASGARDARWTKALVADGEVVWFRRPGAGVKFAMMLRITRMTVTTSRSPRRSRISRKTIARGNAG